MANKKSLPTVRQAFTLIELLIVIAIIGIIAAVVVLGLSQSAKEKARIAQGQQFSDSMRARMEIEIYGNGASGAGLDLEVINGSSPPHTVDASIGGITGTLGDGSCSPGAGSCPTPVSGIKGNALSFDGGDYVDFGDEVEFDISDPFTISFWVKFEAVAGGVLAAKWYAGCSAGWFVSLGSGRVGISLNGDNCGWIIVSELTDPSLDRWYHYAITYDGSGSANGIKIYRDAAEGQSIIVDQPIDTLLNDAPLRIGARGINSMFFNRGILDEVNVSGGVLTAQQIQQYYAESAPRHEIVLK